MPTEYELPPVRERDRPPPPGDRWALHRRAAEGGAWSRLAGGAREAPLRDEMRAPAAPLDYGDVVVLLGPRRTVRRCWVVTAEGPRAAGSPQGAVDPERAQGVVDWGPDWVAAWEGDRADGVALLAAATAAGVDPRRRALAACAAVASVLDLLPPGETLAAEALAAAEALVRGAGTRADVVGLWARLTVAAARAAAAPAAARLHAAAGHAVEAALDPGRAGPSAGRALDEAVRALSAAGRHGAAVERRALAAPVRRWVPLAAVLLARAGAPAPLGAGF